MFRKLSKMEDPKKQKAIEKIQVEIISLNNLRGFLKGKLKGVVENVEIPLIKEASTTTKGADTSGISLKKIKDFFKLKKSLGSNQSNGEQAIEKVGRRGYKLFIFISVIILIIGGVFIVVKGLILPDEPIINKNPFSIKDPSPDDQQSQAPPEDASLPESGEVSYSDLKIAPLLGKDQVSTIKMEQEIKEQENMLVKLLEKANLREPEMVDKKITKEDIYAHVLKNAEDLELDKVYFLNVTDNDGKKLPLTKLTDSMGINLGSEWDQKMSSSLLDYGMAFYLEEDETEAINGVRMGFLLLLEQDKDDTAAYFLDWEDTFAQDMSPLFLGNNQKIISTNKNFSQSSISENRRYINFNQEGSVSLDYALVKDGVVIVTSKNFGSALVDLLKKEGDVKDLNNQK